ncbi:MAG: hypothetical protein ABI231_12085, partial [Candidatus Tumulicola sp.]
VFAALSVITIPITAALVLPPSAAAQIPAVQFLTTLIVFQLVPLIAGALIAPSLPPPTAEKIVKALHAIFLVAALVLVVLIFPRLVSSISSVYGFGHLLIIAAVGVFSIAMGWLLGGPTQPYRRTLSIATLMRNVGLCALIGAGPAFARTAVEPTILTYLVVAIVLSLPVRIFFKRSQPVATGAQAGPA